MKLERASMMVLKQLIFGITAIDDVEPIRLKGRPEFLAFIAVAIGDTGMTGHALNTSKCKCSLAARCVSSTHRPRPSSATPEAVSHRRRSGRARFRRLCPCSKAALLGQFAHDGLQGLGIKDAGSFAERSNEVRLHLSFLQSLAMQLAR